MADWLRNVPTEALRLRLFTELKEQKRTGSGADGGIKDTERKEESKLY